MPTDPAAEFGALVHARLNGRPTTTPAETPPTPPVPRLPAPNRAQGAAITPPAASPLHTFEDAVRLAIHGTPTGGWVEVRP